MARRTSEPQQRKVAIAFAGPGDSTIDNTGDLLDDFLGIKDGQVPEDDVLDLRLVIPATKDHLSAGLKSVVKWTDEYELAYDVVTDVNETKPSRAVQDVEENAEENIPVTNVDKGLIDWLRDHSEDGTEALLVVLWGEKGDESTEVLLDLASSFGIKALDLTAGLDDISFGEDEPAPEAEPEPEPEPEKPARSRRRRAAATEDQTNADETAEARAEVVEKPKRTRSRKAPEKAQDVGPTPEGEETLQEAIARSQADEAQELAMRHAGSQADVVSEPASASDLIVRFVSALDALPPTDAVTVARSRAMEAGFWLSVALEGVRTVAESAPEAEEEPKKGRGRPRTRSASERAVTEFYDEDAGEWVRAGRGRPPAGTKTRKVDPETGEEV